MASKLSRLITELDKNKTDFQKAYNYEVNCARLFYDYQSKRYNLNTFVHEISIPKISLDFETQHTTQFVSKVQPLPDFTISFIETTDMVVSACLDDWQKSMVSDTGYIYPSFISDELMYIQTTDNQGEIKANHVLYNVKPKNIDAVRFGNGQNENIIITATFSGRRIVRQEIIRSIPGSIASAVVLGQDALSFTK